MIALLLAQLVMPSPSVEPLSPPDMICMGECSDGPMVWRASPARGRLVVACDMRSDTCSDGRKIVTERATPVPCETSPGVWEMVGVDEGCYSVRGLESWAQTTTYLSHGAALGESPWVASSSGASLEPLPDGWRIHKSEGGLFGWRQDVSGMADDTYTSTCIVRGSAPGTRLYVSSGNFCTVDIDSEDWTQVSCTRLASASHFLGVYPCGNTDPECSLDVKACWYTQSEFSGRACWGGEAPVTCAADRHTISTEGWPTTEGEIRVGVRLEGDAPDHKAIIDGGEGATFRMAIQTNNAIRLSWDGSNPSTGALTWEYGRDYVISLRFDGSTISMYRDGVFLRDFTYGRPVEWAPVANLGTTGTAWHLNGSIRSLRIRSYE